MDAFMKFDGIDGSSQSKDHKGAIDVVSWNWGVTTQTNGSGSGGASGRPRAHEFRIVHHYDLASPHLASFAATGKHVKDATLNVAHPGARKDFLTVTRATSTRRSPSSPHGSASTTRSPVQAAVRPGEPPASRGTSDPTRWADLRPRRREPSPRPAGRGARAGADALARRRR